MTETLTASKLLTLVFTDLVDSTALKTEKGDEAAAELIARHRTGVEALSGETGGRIIDWAGDGCFQTFDTASAAVTFALKLQEAHAAESDLPQVRTGIHMGEVTEAPGAGGALRVEGLAVDIAARIQSLALPGQIVMSSAVFNSVRQRLKGNEFASPIAWRAHGAYLFKGFDDPMEVGEVGIEGAAPLEAPTASEKAQRAVAPTEEDTLGWRPAAGLEIPGHAHWVLDRQLGLGGYGEVWLASNINTHAKHVFKFCFQADRLRGLKREVVLFRLLKESLGDRDDIARVLDWDLENQPYFIETDYTEGGDLKIWAQEKGGLGEVALETRLELVAQTATALGAAHSAGVLHKDIKPANILITESSGTPKASLTDFGIGLLTDPEALKAKGITATGLTKTLVAGKSSSTSGTGMYLAPELHEGKAPSEKSDLYGLGVVLYQMAIGDLNHAMATGWERDVEDPLLREDIAACVDGNPDHRLGTAEEVAQRLRSLDQRRAQQDDEARVKDDSERADERRKRAKQRLMNGAIAAAVLLVIGVLAAALLRTSSLQSDEAWAREEAMPQLASLVEDEDYVRAYELANEVEGVIPMDPTLQSYLDQISSVISIQTEPPGASVAYRPYSEPNADWVTLGQTPLQEVRLPRGDFVWQLELEGYQARTFVNRVWHESEPNPGALGKSLDTDLMNPHYTMYRNDDVPPDSIPVDGGSFLMGITGLPLVPYSLDAFFIDRTEVTNRAYKEFVDAGGYTNPDYWKQAFSREDMPLSFEEAMSRFVDTTGRPGPATWEVGDFPEGRGEYPVQGVSWFEASAYAEFRGKQLPTIYHWNRMALPLAEIITPFSPAILPLSNIGGGDGAAAVGSFDGLGYSGAHDVAGNVREWCLNGNGDRRYLLGGAWSDVLYMFTQGASLPAWNRDPTNGFRCMSVPDSSTAHEFFSRNVDLEPVDYAQIEPISDEVFEIYKGLYAYDPLPLEDRLDEEWEDERGWRHQIITLDAVYGEQRIILHVYLPVAAPGPYPAVVYFPGIDSVQMPEYTVAYEGLFDFVIKSGRALVFPIYSGMYERGGGPTLLRLTNPNASAQLIKEWGQDLGRTVDYLETRPDVSTEKLGFWGVSLGASLGPIMLGTSDRFSVAILMSGGLFPYRAAIEAKPEASAVTYLPRVTLPSLILSGRFDYVFPVDSAQMPFVELLGTPDEHKRYVTFDAGHVPLPRAETIKEVLTWLDKYQGEIAPGTDP